MKKTIRIISLLLSLGMLVGCSATPNEKSNQTSQGDNSQQQSQNQGGSSAQGGQSSSAAQATPGEFTFDEAALNNPQEIHTADQKKYLNLHKHLNTVDLKNEVEDLERH